MTKNRRGAPQKNPVQNALSPQQQSQFQQALALHQQGQLSQAKLIYEQILKVQPRHFDSLHLAGVIAYQTGELAQGFKLISEAIRLNPAQATPHSNLGLVLQQLGRLEEAVASYDKALALKPDYAEAHNNRGIALKDLKRLEEAVASYDKALSIMPGYAQAYNNRGNAQKDLKRLDDALASYDQALSIKPDYAPAWNNRGNALTDLMRLDDALASYDKALSITPGYAQAWSNRGMALLDLKRLDDALASCDKALALEADYAQAHYNRGNALLALKRLDEALSAYDKALLIKPDYPQACNGRGIVLQELRRLDEALANYDKALGLQADYAQAHNNRGNVLLDLKRPEEALASYDRAISLKPDYAQAYRNRGNALLDLNRLDDAVASYEQALSIDPDLEFLFGMCLHTRMKLCDWHALPDALRRLEADIASGKPVTAPFPILALIDSPQLHKMAAEVYTQAKHPRSHVLGPISMRPMEGKIRVGYYSADFHNHATAYLMAELFESHDADKFELYGFSFGPDKQDQMRARVSGAFDRFYDVRAKSDREIAQLSRDMGIDIAVDLKGYTQGARANIFAHGCAPIQVSYLGYPGTLGAPYIDYVIADKMVIPPDRRSDFIEKVVYLPHSYQVNDSKRKISERVFTKHELGLPESGFVFCCFNNNYKIQPATFDGWMKILKAVDGSVLWLLEDNATAAMNLRRHAQDAGVDARRLVFAKRMKPDEHLARHRLADLFLDTLACNAHTTASDALWAGLPVLTCLGKAFAGRVAGSLLSAIELPELITQTQADYEARAIELATNPDKLQEIKSKLQKNRNTAPLFDGKLFAMHIESAYASMFARHQAGLPPDHIEVN